MQKFSLRWLLPLALINIAVFSYAEPQPKAEAKDSADSVEVKKTKKPVNKVKLPRAVESVSWNEDCTLFGYSENKNITVRYAHDFSLYQTIVSPVPVNSQDFAGFTATEERSNQLVAFNENNSILIRRLPDTTPVIERHLDENYVISKYAFARNGNYIAIGTEAGIIEIGQQLYYSSDIITHKMEGHTQKVYELAFSPNRRYLASASTDGTIRIWRTATRQQHAVIQQKLPPPQNIPICFTSDSEHIIAASQKRLIEIRDFQDVVTGTIETTQDIVSLCLSPDGNYVVVLTNMNQFHYYSLDTYKKVKFIPAWNMSPVTCYKFSNDGLSLLVGHSDGSIYILKLEDVLYLDGEVPEDYTFIDQDTKKEEEFSPEQLEALMKERYGEEDFVPERIATPHNVDVRLQGVYAVNDYYNWGVKLGAGYVNTSLFDFCYVGGLVCPTLFFPDNDDFPYDYKIANIKIDRPLLGELDMLIFAGKEWDPWPHSDWDVYAEAFVGGAFKEIMSPTLGSGKLNTAFITGGLGGFKYRNFRFYAEMSYDSVVQLQFSLGVGYRVNITKSLSSKNVEEFKEKDRQERKEEAQKTVELIELKEKERQAESQQPENAETDGEVVIEPKLDKKELKLLEKQRKKQAKEEARKQKEKEKAEAKARKEAEKAKKQEENSEESGESSINVIQL